MKTKRLGLLISIILMAGGLMANADSLRVALAKAPLDQRAHIQLQLSRTLLKSDPEQALQYAISAVQQATKHDQTAQVADALRMQGNYYYQSKLYQRALEYYQRALPHALKAKDAKLLGDIYNNIGHTQLHLAEYPQSEKNLKTALEYRRKLPSPVDNISTLNILALLYWHKQDYNKALLQYQTAARLLDKSVDNRLASITYNNLGNAYLKTGNIAQALEAYIRSLELKKRFGNEKDIAVSSFSIGNLFLRNGDYEKALKYYHSARQMYEMIGEINEAKQVDSNLGVVYNALGNYYMAISHHNSALEFYRKHSMEKDMAKTLNNLGKVYQNQKNYLRAIDCYSQSKAIKSRLNDQEGLAVTEANIGEIFYKTGDFAKALSHTQASLAISLNRQDKLLAYNNYRQLSKIHAALGDYKSAWQSLEEYVILDQYLHEEKNLSAIAEAVNRLDTQERIQEISELRGEKQQTEAELKRLARQRILFVITALVGTLFSISLVVLYRQKKGEIVKGNQLRQALETLNLELEERIAREMDKYRQQQQVLNQKSKLESLGTLAAGIAHEINQPLSAISMSIDNIVHKVIINRIDKEYLEKKSRSMRADVERIRSIIEHVRLFSRFQSEEAIEHVDINSTLSDTVTIFGPALSKIGLSIQLVLCSTRVLVLGNRFKLEQVLFNLLSNARDTILEKLQHQDNEQDRIIKIGCVKEEETVIICVTDRGMGIPSEAQSKIFDPFFTTKDPDKGTGLGMAISYGIVNDMCGSLTFQSQTGEGSSFQITLPILRV